MFIEEGSSLLQTAPFLDLLHNRQLDLCGGVGFCGFVTGQVDIQVQGDGLACEGLGNIAREADGKLSVAVFVDFEDALILCDELRAGDFVSCGFNKNFDPD